MTKKSPTTFIAKATSHCYGSNSNETNHCKLLIYYVIVVKVQINDSKIINRANLGRAD